LTLINGVSRIVAQDTRVVSSRYSLKTDAQTEVDVRKGVTLGAIAVKYVLSEALTARYVNKTSLLKHLGHQLQALRSGAVAQLGGDAIDILRAFRSGGHINRLVGTAIVAGAVVAIGGIVTGAVFLGEAKFSSDPQANLGVKITICILTDALGLVFSTVLPIVGAVQWINTARATGQSFGALSVMNAAASKVAVVGTIIAAGITWGFFIYSMVENKVSAFSPGFNRAFAEAIATTVFLIFLFIFSFTLIGTIIVAIVAAIDAILIAICELGVDELRTVPGLGGACFSLGTSAVKVLAYLFYNFDLMVDTGRSDLVVTGAPDVQLADPSKGYVAGQTIRIGLPITTTVVHKDPDPANGLYIFPYLWLYSSDSLRNNTFRYSLTTQPETINAEGGSMRNVWVGLAEDHKFVQTPMYRVHNFTNPTPVSGIPLQVGLNQAAAFQLNMGYAVVAYECWGIPNLAPPFIPPIIPICYRRNDGLVGNNSTPINSLKFDVFPATLDGLMTLGGRANGAYGLDWDVRFPALPDADGDGLLGSAFNGIDPDDSRVDTDNDGLSDAFELERRQAGLAISPILADSDNDGLSDKDEMAFGSNPGIADTDNDGLTDKQEHDGWDVTINGATSFTLRVTSNPNQGDSDADSISDQAERQLALDANPAGAPGARLDSENRPYHPNVPNAAPLAVYTKTDDSDGYVRPGASVRYTTTVVASVAMAPGVLDVSAPAAILGAPAPAALGFDPNTFNTTQTVEQAALLTVAANASGELGLTSTARTRLAAGATGAPWVWDPATTETALGSFASGKAPRFIAATAATADRQDSYRFAGMASTALTGDNGGLGDIWSFDIPGGGARTLESDTDTTTSPPLADNAALRGTTSPAIACNNAGVCLAVWPEYKNCNTVTINSLKVVSAGSDTNGGIEPVITFGNSTSGEHWLWYWGNGGGTADLHAGDQRGPNAHGFPVTREFCGSAPIYVWESDEPSYEPVGNFSPPAGDFVNRVVSFSGSGHTIELDITIPEKKLHAITGRIIGQDGTIQLANLAVTAATPADEGNSGPVVASDGTNFLVGLAAACHLCA